MGKRAGNAIMADERLRERKPRHKFGHCAKGNARLLAKPERLIETQQDGSHILGMEPPLEARARQIVELTNALQSQPPQEERTPRLEPQGLYGKRTKRVPDLSMRHDGWGARRVAGKRMSPS